MTKTLKQRVQRHLARKDIRQWIERHISSGLPGTCYDSIVFAEYLERKHGVGFVVYFCKASDRFSVCNVSEYYEPKSHNCFWMSEPQWHTDLAHAWLEQREAAGPLEAAKK